MPILTSPHWGIPHFGEGEEARIPGIIVNFTISIISEICRKIVHRDFELD